MKKEVWFINDELCLDLIGEAQTKKQNEYYDITESEQINRSNIIVWNENRIKYELHSLTDEIPTELFETILFNSKEELLGRLDATIDNMCMEMYDLDKWYATCEIVIERILNEVRPKFDRIVNEEARKNKEARTYQELTEITEKIWSFIRPYWNKTNLKKIITRYTSQVNGQQ